MSDNSFDFDFPNIPRLRMTAMDMGYKYTETKIDFPDRGGNGDQTTDTGGAFYGMRTVSSGPNVGDIYLQGGMVSGGTGNDEISEFKLYDAGSKTWTGSPGSTLIITASGTGQATNGILDPIWNLDTATLSKTSAGSNSLPTATSAGSGKICYILIGSYFDGGFSPSGAGNININFCWGSYSISRI